MGGGESENCFRTLFLLRRKTLSLAENSHDERSSRSIIRTNGINVFFPRPLRPLFVSGNGDGGGIGGGGGDSTSLRRRCRRRWRQFR